MGCVHVVAGAHDDVEPGGAGHPCEGERIAGQAAIGGIHEGLAPRVLEEQGLVAGHALVEELKVVEVGAEVLPHPAEIGQADRLPGEPALAAVRRLLEHHLEVDEEMLVGQGDAHGLPCDGAEHGLRLSGERRSWHRRASCAAQAFTVKTGAERTLTPGPCRELATFRCAMDEG